MAISREERAAFLPYLGKNLVFKRVRTREEIVVVADPKGGGTIKGKKFRTQSKCVKNVWE